MILFALFCFSFSSLLGGGAKSLLSDILGSRGIFVGLKQYQKKDQTSIVKKKRLYYPYLPPPFARAGYGTRSIFKRSFTGLISEFSFSETSCLTKAEEPSLPYYLPIAGGRIIGFIPFPRGLVQCEMQSVSSRIWTHVAVFISYDVNHYTTCVQETH